MAGRNIRSIGASAFEGEKLREPGTWLVDFGAAWCPPCRAIEPGLNAIAEKFAGRLGVAYVDSDEEQDLSVTFGVTSLPTLLVFRDGALVDRWVGAASEATMTKRVLPYLEPIRATG